jgi:hypothetical protein
MKKLIVVALVASVALLAGCEEETKTYAWYKDHPDETYTVYKKCLETGEASLNCEGARRAAIAFGRGGDKDLEQKFNSLK